VSLDYDYHLAQRYHGPGSATFREALRRVPLGDQWVDDCSQCGHAVFLQRAVTEVPGSAPLICVHCVVGQYVDTNTVLNLETCPASASPCPYGTRSQPKPHIC
jgi:hypothetical protein